MRLLARALHAISLEHTFRVAAFHGGNAHNAIPREATATILATRQLEAIRDRLNSELRAIRDEFRPAEPSMEFSIETAAVPEQVWSADSTAEALQLIVSLPHGVTAMSYAIDGLVETSTNEAVVKESDGRLMVLMSSRSSEASALTSLRQRIRAIASLAGADVDEANGYPGWKPNVNSHLLEVVQDVYSKLSGKEPEVGAVHAGLECGIIGEKYPGMDMISFGPQIEFPHSPDERVKVDSVATFWNLLTKTLERLA